MKLDEMKIQYERSRDGFTKESKFAVRDEKPLPKVNVNGIAIKVSLCAGVLALAFIVRAFGFGAPKTDAVQSVSSHVDSGEQAVATQPGRLKYVDAVGEKWKAPVEANDIELLREGQMLRFTARDASVSSCMAGTVLAVGTDDAFGAYVRVQSASDCETFYYGLDTIAVEEGQTVAAGDPLGTVAPGRSLYLRVLQDGAPQDPTQYVDLSLHV